MKPAGLSIFIAVLSASVLGCHSMDNFNLYREWEETTIDQPNKLDIHLVLGPDDVFNEDKAFISYRRNYFTGKRVRVLVCKANIDQNGQLSFKELWRPTGLSNEHIHNVDRVKITVISHGNMEFTDNNNRKFNIINYNINHLEYDQLATVVEELMKNIQSKPQVDMRFITCNAGTNIAGNYMTRFMKDVNNRGINLHQMVAYDTFVSTTDTFNVFQTKYEKVPENILFLYNKHTFPIEDYLENEGTWEYAINIKDERRVLFTYQNGNVKRSKFRKITNDHNRGDVNMESNINQNNDQIIIEEQLIERILNRLTDKFNACTLNRRRRRRALCNVKEGKIQEEFVVKEKSLLVKDGRVEVEVASRRNPEETHLVSFSLDESRTFYTRQVEENAMHQGTRVKNAASGTVLDQINRGMAVYGIVAGFIGAGKFFAENDTARGTFTLTQSLHGLGGLTGVNKQLSSMSQYIFKSTVHKGAEKLGLEKTLERVSSSLERFGETTAGQFLKAIPFVGLGFQIYFIAEDSIDIQRSNNSYPEQKKYYGLKVTNLVLDVSTTVLTLAEVGFPPAAFILEPIIIGLTIARMAISDFYCDVVSELDRLPKGANDIQKMAAVLKGLEEGAVDFVTGGLLREIQKLDDEYRQNQELLQNLSSPGAYYKIVASDGNVSTIDLTEGRLSQYGGLITVRLSNNGDITIQIGGIDDGRSGVKTIIKTFHNPAIQSIVLGVGESRQFLYTQKAAHLWWVIPVHYEKVICGELLLHSSLFGTYYGNDKDNSFFAPQLPAAEQHPADPSDPCAYGDLNLDYVIRNYHYTIHGHGGEDSFFLGQQASLLSGGEGRDLYIFPTNGTISEIDNFAHDSFEDHLVIKAPFSHIDCIRNHTDLLLVYGQQKKHQITIGNWFAHSDIDHYQHMTFQSADGVMFKIEDRGLIEHKFHANCVPETLDNTKSQSPVSLRLEGDYQSVIRVLGSNFSDIIVGNKRDNVFNGGPGVDRLEGGEGADTYEIFPAEGCDIINNYATDQKVDLVVFHVPFQRIRADLQGEDLWVTDEEKPGSTCLKLQKWNNDSRYQHLAFLSSDHVTFSISNSEDSGVVETPLMVDLSTEKHGSIVELNKADRHLHSVVTVFDSPYDDVIIGNALGNFLSCSGGTDFLKGGGGSDKYIIKAGCRGANISNLAEDKISDVLFIQHAWGTIKTEHRFPHLVLKVADTDIEVKLLHWFEGENFHHLAVQTIDGIIATLPLNASDPEVMIPMEINLSKEECTDQKQMFDLSKDPWRKVQRFQAKSNKCSYTVIGNELDNFIDPGTGNINNYQYLRGGNGSDTYVLGHAYGYENEIDNKAEDMKPDNLFLQVLYEDIEVLLERPHIIMFSRSRNDSVRVRLLKYLQGLEFQHLLVRSLDGFLFEIDGDSYPYKSVLSIDMTSSSKSCNISCVSSKSEYSKVSKIHGSTAFSNYITGSSFSYLITGGNMADYILGNQGSEKIEGFGGNDVIIGEGGDDVLEGGEGEDEIRGGEGDDFIYGGGGADRIDGGPGVDTVFFSGDVRTGSGVTVDLVTGRGGGADAENDTFTGVERVIGTEFNDLLIGDNEDNQLIGKFGNDTLVPGHGSDLLCGGPGRDFYILEDSSGVKHIDNFATDRIEDCILIRNFAPKDACFFTQEGNLVISLHYQDQNPLLNLMGRDTLTIILDNWRSNHSLYQHISFVFENNTYIDPSYFNSATEISPSLKDFNSSNISLRLTHANETAVEVEGMVLGRAGSETESMFQYWLKVSDQLFHSDSLSWGNSTSLEITGLLSGVLYTFQLYLMKCEVPVLVLQEVVQRTRPNPPLSLNVLRVTHSRVMINWLAPTRDSDPDSERYAYVVRVKEQSSTQVVHFNTSNPRLEIHDLKPKSVYMVSVSSVMEEMESREAFFPPIETSNLCQEFITPRGSTVIEEKMTADGPVAVIKCLEGYRLISVSELPCTPGLFLSHGPCVPRDCTHRGSIVSHGGSVNVPCLGFHFESHCNFSTLQPSPPRCCSSLSEIANGQLHSFRDSNSITMIYSCNPGYDLSGAFRFTCQVESGEWSPSPTLVMPHCEPIPCPDPPQDPHGQFHSPSDRTGSFKEGDTLSLRCDYLYHSSTEESSITCRRGHWGLVPSCEPSIRLVNVQDGLYDLVGILQVWRSGSWTFMTHFRDIDNFSRHSCNVRQLELVKVTRMSFSIQVECRKVKLQTAGSEYTGIVEGNVDGEGWRKICIQDSTAAKALCRKLFPDQEWTASVIDSGRFVSQHTHTCDSWSCRFKPETRHCYKQIQCRHSCDPYAISNGVVSCASHFEGESCSVNCYRLYNLKGPSRIRCTRSGWSSFPYCIESGNCGYDFERGPHFIQCLSRLWLEAGCSLNTNGSPTRNPDLVRKWNTMTVDEVRRDMAEYPRDGLFTYNPYCQEDEECFPAHATVLTSDGSRRTMAELRLGDRVLAVNAAGQPTFSEVLLWLDRRSTGREHYLLLDTEGSEETLYITPDHVLFIAPDNTTTSATATRRVPAFAKDILPGHLLYRHNPSTGSLEAKRVTDVRESESLGAYAPLTVEGNLVVDGHLVSCYTLQCRQNLAHLPFAPYRLLHTLRSSIPFLGDLLLPSPWQGEDREAGGQEGMHWYANAWYQLGLWMGYPFGETCYPSELQRYHYPRPATDPL
ncbi:uncharacterized protein LOC127426464 isoform X2 [Myxocyprinus asiaticus]|uniref:uncharacterized protein LOC127426464 isoform X2 n=1 Tax=Myxocyprinus asiaticus TaxID=70543 RepID=UPI002221AF9B|nr:uncharacterized protein LOC127426464 isoform X2 [Myxocyprinus asiaticus]